MDSLSANPQGYPGQMGVIANQNPRIYSMGGGTLNYFEQQ
jgi:hypothetical protein